MVLWIIGKLLNGERRAILFKDVIDQHGIDLKRYKAEIEQHRAEIKKQKKINLEVARDNIKMSEIYQEQATKFERLDPNDAVKWTIKDMQLDSLEYERETNKELVQKNNDLETLNSSLNNELKLLKESFIEPAPLTLKSTSDEPKAFIK